MSELSVLREALAKIAAMVDTAGTTTEGNGYGPDLAPQGVCTPKALPQHLQVRAAQTATDLNPMNAPAIGFLPADDRLATLVADPLSIAVLTSKYWGTARRCLTVSFVETTPADLRARILSHLNAWACGIQFVETSGTGQVRISRGAGGY